MNKKQAMYIKLEKYSPVIVICPNGRSMHYMHTNAGVYPSGYETHKQVYRRKNCDGSALDKNCLKDNQTVKTIYLDIEWQEHKKKNAMKILDKENAKYFKKCSSVKYGYVRLKHNYKLSRLGYVIRG